VVLAVKTGVVKLLPVANAVPPAAFAYQVIIAFGSASVAVKVVVLPEQIDVPPFPAIGAAGNGDTIMFTAVRVTEAQPVVLSASA
jgi:hypothetical protein